MTREEVKEMMPIIQAFADGKTIEFFNHEGKWQEVFGCRICLRNQQIPHQARA